MKYTVHELANTKGTAKSVREALLMLESMVIGLNADKQELLEILQDVIDTGFTGGPQGKRARAIVAKHKEKT